MNAKRKGSTAKKSRTGSSKRAATVPDVTVAETGRLASVVAAEITKQIIAAGWPVGQGLGTEAELMRRYRVSREPLREGVRILEFQGLLKVERGARGGLIVQAPAIRATSGVLRTYLQLHDFSAGEILSAMRVMHGFISERAALQINSRQFGDLRSAIGRARESVVRAPQSVHVYDEISAIISEVAANPAATMFSDTLLTTVMAYASPSGQPTDSIRSHSHILDLFEQLADALSKRDAAGVLAAREEMLRNSASSLADLQKRNQAIWNLQSFLSGEYRQAFDEAQDEQRAAVALAYAIAAKIRREQLPAGALIGSQKTLLDEHQSSRAVLREASRLLEFFGVVEVRLGSQGGLLVSAANPSYTIDSVVTYLSYAKITSEQIVDLRRYLQARTARELSSRLTLDDVMNLRSAVAVLASPTSAAELVDQIDSLCRQLFSRLNNRPIELFATIMLALSAPTQSHAISAADAQRISQAREDCVVKLSAAFLQTDASAIERHLNELQEIGRASLQASKR